MIRALKSRRAIVPLVAAWALALGVSIGGSAPGNAQERRGANEGRTIEGEVLLGAKVGAFRGATLIIVLSDTTQLDVASKPLAKLIVSNISNDGRAAPTLPFHFALGDVYPSPNNDYSVEVYLAFNPQFTPQGDYLYRKGDFQGMARYSPSNPEQARRPLRITLERI